MSSLGAKGGDDGAVVSCDDEVVFVGAGVDSVHESEPVSSVELKTFGVDGLVGSNGKGLFEWDIESAFVDALSPVGFVYGALSFFEKDQRCGGFVDCSGSIIPAG